MGNYVRFILADVECGNVLYHYYMIPQKETSFSPSPLDKRGRPDLVQPKKCIWLLRDGHTIRVCVIGRYLFAHRCSLLSSSISRSIIAFRLLGGFVCIVIAR